MCRPFSLILTKDQTVYYHPNPIRHSHTLIMKHFNIKESSLDPRLNQFVKIEISPKNNNYKSNPDDWKIAVDEEYTPSWYEEDKESYETIIRKQAKNWLKRFNEYFSKITDPKEAYEYCDILNIPVKELEPIIATDACHSYLYAKHVLEGRFELGEKAIATDACYSCFYADNVLEGRFDLGEKSIAKSAYYSHFYAKDVLKDRFILGEPTIKNSVGKQYYEKIFNVKL